MERSAYFGKHIEPSNVRFPQHRAFRPQTPLAMRLCLENNSYYWPRG